MSDLDRLDRLAEAVDVALARRDLAGYKIASTAYTAVLDQIRATVEARRREINLGLAELDLFRVELPTP